MLHFNPGFEAGGFLSGKMNQVERKDPHMVPGEDPGKKEAGNLQAGEHTEVPRELQPGEGRDSPIPCSLCLFHLADPELCLSG